jgi:hypothetical protein
MPVKITYAFLATCPVVVGIGMFIVGRIQRRISPSGSLPGWNQPVKPVAAQAGIQD